MYASNNLLLDHKNINELFSIENEKENTRLLNLKLKNFSHKISTITINSST